MPISNYLECINNLRKNTLENISVESNHITGTIQADQDEILQISVPYSKGYTVYIDGKKTESFSSGVAYLGVKVAKGNHSVEIRYRTPLLLPGFIVTMIGTVMFVGYLIVCYKKK